jgi:hypothetical protein
MLRSLYNVVEVFYGSFPIQCYGGVLMYLHVYKVVEASECFVPYKEL